MRKDLFLAVTVFAPMLAPNPASALPTNLTYGVYSEGDLIGRWELRNRVEDRGAACSYTVRWSDINRAPLGRTVLCTIDEFKAGDFFDCEDNRTRFFDTVVMKGRGTCRGFDDFGQQTIFDTIIAGESRTRMLSGIFENRSIGDVQNLVIR